MAPVKSFAEEFGVKLIEDLTSADVNDFLAGRVQSGPPPSARLDEDQCDPCLEIHEVPQVWDIQEGYTCDDGQEWVFLSTVISVPVEDLELMEDLLSTTRWQDEAYPTHRSRMENEMDQI